MADLHLHFYQIFCLFDFLSTFKDSFKIKIKRINMTLSEKLLQKWLLKNVVM